MILQKIEENKSFFYLAFSRESLTHPQSRIAFSILFIYVSFLHTCIFTIGLKSIEPPHGRLCITN